LQPPGRALEHNPAVEAIRQMRVPGQGKQAKALLDDVERDGCLAEGRKEGWGGYIKTLEAAKQVNVHEFPYSSIPLLKHCTYLAVNVGL
jgi:hypothetical protein